MVSSSRLLLLKRAAHLKRGDDLDCTLLRLRAKRYTAAAKPALLRIQLDRRLTLFRIGSEFVAHADVDTRVAPRARLLVEIDVFKRHLFLLVPMLSWNCELFQSYRFFDS
jgi:hypothetical protein